MNKKHEIAVQNATDKFRKIAVDELSKIKDSVITQHANGYVIFNKFRLKLENDVYQVTDMSNNMLNIFYTSASAVGWCMAIYKAKYKTADEIFKLDTIVNNRKNEHEFYLIRIATAKTDERRSMYRAKWEENYTRLKHSQEEMRKLLSLTKYYNSL